eukprot:5236873-Lingulodinium_polyedra.AAC.1
MAGSTGFGCARSTPSATRMCKYIMLSSRRKVHSAWYTCGVLCKLPTLPDSPSLATHRMALS